jgi:hypothetical protein
MLPPTSVEAAGHVDCHEMAKWGKWKYSEVFELRTNVFQPTNICSLFSIKTNLLLGYYICIGHFC